MSAPHGHPPGFRYVDVKSPGAKGTINLMWGDYPIQWINNLEIAAEIKAHLNSDNVQGETQTPKPNGEDHGHLPAKGDDE